MTPDPSQATDTGASTTGLGPQPAGYELQAPGVRPHGVMIVLHGGGWIDVGPGALAEVRREARLWLGRGWATANLDYRACGQSLPDVVVMYDQIRALVGPAPIAVVGESAGAHLALMLAVRRPEIVAVIAKAPPTNAATLAEQLVYDPATGLVDSHNPAGLAAVWEGAFGERWITDSSPTQQAAGLNARLLLARGQEDPVIPAGQLTDLATAVLAVHPEQWVRVLDMPSGPVWFPHTSITVESEASYHAAALEAVAPWQTDTSSEVPAHVDGWWKAPAVVAPSVPVESAPSTAPAEVSRAPQCAVSGPAPGNRSAPLRAALPTKKTLIALSQEEARALPNVLPATVRQRLEEAGAVLMASSSRGDGMFVQHVQWMRDRRAAGRLRVTGKRIDASGGEFRVSISRRYPGNRFARTVSSSLMFGEPGCWRIKARAGKVRVSYVVLVRRPVPGELTL